MDKNGGRPSLRTRLLWLGIALVVSLAVLAGLALDRVARAQNHIRAAQQEAQGSTGEVVNLFLFQRSEILARLDRIEGHLQAADQDLAPFKPFLPVLRWIPGAGPELEAWEPLSHMALSLTRASRATFLAVRPAVEVNPRDKAVASLLAELAARLREGEPFLEMAQGELRGLESARESLQGKRLSRRGREASLTLEDYASLLGTIIEGVHQATSAIEAAYNYRSPETTGPPAGPLLDIEEGLAQAWQRSLVAAQTLTGLLPLGTFSPDFGPQVQNALNTAAGSLDLALSGIRQAQEGLAQTNTAGLPHDLKLGLDGLAPMLPSLERSLEQALDLLRLLPSLLGVDSPKRYLILAQDEDERRATGGFIAAAWLVEFNRGVLTNWKFFDSYEVDDLTRELPPPPMYKYLWAGVWLFRDSNWYPDFPTSAGVAAKFFERGQGVSVDGVIGLNKEVVRALVAALGPVVIPGRRQPVSGEDVVEMLNRREAPVPMSQFGRPRRPFMRALGQGIRDKLAKGLSAGEVVALVQALDKALAQKHLLLFMGDEIPAKTLRKWNWDGAIAASSGDYLMVVDSNFYSGKVDRVVEREVRYEVSFLGGTEVRARLTVTYFNRAPLIKGCVQYSEYRVETWACYWNFFRIYVPTGSQLLSATRLPLHPGSLLYRQGGQRLIDTVDTILGEPGGKAVFGGFLVVPGGGSKEVTFEYLLPPSLLQPQGGAYRYALTVQKQPGTPPIPIAFTFSLPPGWKLAERPSFLVPQGENRFVG